MTSTLTLTTRFAELAHRYDVVLSDVWGVIHNGVASFPETCDALARFRAKGGVVVLITNAPRPGDSVLRQLDALHVPREAYDGIATSGDVTRAAIFARAGQSVFHLGPERDKPIFAGIDLKFAALNEADYVVCSGLFDDETETPDDYRARLEILAKRKTPMICANPDVVVERGHQLVYCAGAIADLYATMGGDVLYAGKPYRPIYELALDCARKAGADTELSRVLAIGDSIRTDLKGAVSFGVDCLFVTEGIHAEELGARHDPDLRKLETMFAAAGHQPVAVTRRVTW